MRNLAVVTIVFFALVCCDDETGTLLKGMQCVKNEECASGACVQWSSSTGKSCTVCGGEECGTCAKASDQCTPGPNASFYCVPYDPCGPITITDGGGWSGR